MNDLYQKLHETYSAQRYDSTDVWAGHLRVRIGGTTYPATLARSYSDVSHTAVVVAELYVRDTDWTEVSGEIAARVWSDANDLGSIDERGRYHRGVGPTTRCPSVVTLRVSPFWLEITWCSNPSLFL